jgi:uncharacterized protein (TIGR03000 family)
MSRSTKQILALGVVLAVTIPAYAGGGKGGGGGHGHGSHHGSHGHHNHHSSHGHHRHHHHHHHGHYRYYGVWPYGYYAEDPDYVVTGDVITADDSPDSYESEDDSPEPVAAGPAVVRVHTYPGAKIWFDGAATSQTGEYRTFTTPPLDGGKTYSYSVKARWLEDGRPVVRTRTVNVEAGETSDVDMQ